MGLKMREAEPTGMAALMETRMWNADNIPMPLTIRNNELWICNHS